MNAEEAVELVELGFEYVTGEYNDGGKIFRKRDFSLLGSLSVPEGSWSSMDLNPTGDNSRKSTFFVIIETLEVFICLRNAFY